MKKFLKLFFCGVLMSLWGTLAAQDITVRGTMTDVNGKFSLTMANDAVLQVSFLGYVTREVSITSVGEGQPLAIIMEEESKTLDEVVVVGYGFQKKATLSGSVSAISGNEIVKSPAMNVSNSLAGSL